ncbi:thiamine ABC transporter substrate-binding protein [Nocardioides gilvus]|uniref:thiamine ABC transporter substrate-binding protein n=1 Tax=Nocardioides gilvus TaxID=1735589 RepID=UPI000D74F166|nr:thiamine ABC transporter substrate-binding protein [Nocardioides gilvus]
MKFLPISLRGTRRATTALAALTVLTGASLAGCSLVGGDSGSEGDAAKEVVLVTHDSFSLPDEVVAQFEEEHDIKLVVRGSGDAGALSAKLGLTAAKPIGDVAFGIDNTFASRTLDDGVFAEHSVELPPGAEEYALEEGGDRLVPVDTGHVCVNVDKAWFDKEGVAPPVTLADLTKAPYKDLMVVPSAASSSPGMAFLLTTHAAFGDDWKGYWEDLLDNGVKIVDGWSDAYYADFTAGGEAGKRPIVLSYDSSPAFTLDDDGESTTEALLETCFRQVEYAGVLEGAANPEAAELVLEFLLSEEVQSALPTSMYVYPVADATEIPDEWAAWAPSPTDPFVVPPDTIAEQRDTWLKEWTDLATR